MANFKFKKLIIFLVTVFFINTAYCAEQNDPIKVDWSFKGLTGKFDRASLQRGFSGL